MTEETVAQASPLAIPQSRKGRPMYSPPLQRRDKVHHTIIPSPVGTTANNLAFIGRPYGTLMILFTFVPPINWRAMHREVPDGTTGYLSQTPYVSKLPSGTYFLKIATKRGITVRKIVRE